MAGSARVAPMEIMDFLISGYTPYIPTTDQPLAQKMRLKTLIFFIVFGLRCIEI